MEIDCQDYVETELNIIYSSIIIVVILYVIMAFITFSKRFEVSVIDK